MLDRRNGQWPIGARQRLDPDFAIQRHDQVGIVAARFARTIFEFGENELDAIDGRKNQRDPLMRRRCSIAQAPDQRFGRVGEMGEAGKAQKAAGSLDRMDEAKNARDDTRVGRIALEQHELVADGFDMFRRLDQEILEQLIHQASPRTCARRKPFGPTLRQMG